jgi:hypothetical protein
MVFALACWRNAATTIGATKYGGNDEWDNDEGDNKLGGYEDEESGSDRWYGSPVVVTATLMGWIALS